MFKPLSRVTNRAALLAATLLMFVSPSLLALEHEADMPTPQSSITSVKALIGLPGITPDSTGTLSFGPDNLRFTTNQGFAEIARKRIIGVSSGDERVEIGGGTGKVARALIPYGGGLALGAVAHKKVGLITIEFMDKSGEYHGAVFVLKTGDVATALSHLDLRTPALYAPVIDAAASCPAAKVQADAVRIEMIGADVQSAFPAEDRVLLYEHLVQRLKSERTVLNVYRAGDRTSEGNCAEFTVTIRAIAFSKGDQAVRASVGPLGHFVGTTKLTYHLTVATQDGTLILNRDMKKSEGSDSDSLNVTKAISKSVAKSLRKSRNQLRKEQTA